MTSTSVTALAIIAALILVLHIAAGTVLAHPPTNPSPDMLTDDATCPGEAKPPVSSSPFD
ncbi:hypothetical protein [Bradyrhizobium sp.]|jgi:hypothetical protein|uniref:hypothetical protein n=1 Tax=Bradyrhizobium sp. TaxID=376 RepID=UPI002CB3FD55|nr:hypothetical protein [Bradyrhizobium sp.]HMM89281.1 hypothetical protein [Bradyrhizobium sp.]